MIYNEQPEDFIPDMEVVGCLVEHNNKILLLHRHEHKPEGGKWGLPGGKVNRDDEDEKMAVKREVMEETGLVLDENNLSYYKTFFVSHPNYNFYYHYFNLILDSLPEIIISEDEHKTYTWVTPEEALEMPLVLDEEYCLKNYYGIE